MKIGITGGLGFIGTNLVRRLQALDGSVAEIRILDNLTNPSGDLEIGEGIEVIEGDVREPAAVVRLAEGMDVVVHLAAHTRVIDSIEDPELNFDVNCVGTFNVLQAVRRCEVGSLINASTGGAILGEVPPPIHEEIAAKPASPYGASKLMGEGYCSAFAESYGIAVTSLRFSNIYGPHSRRKSSVVAAFIKDFTERGAVTVYGDGTQTRDYLYVDDLVDGILAAIEARVSGVYQLGSGRPTSVNELIDVLKAVSGHAFDVHYEDFRAGEIRHTYCNIERARSGFGFSPDVAVDDGVAKTWAWFVEHGLV